jgi:hypothetical protein
MDNKLQSWRNPDERPGAQFPKPKDYYKGPPVKKRKQFPEYLKWKEKFDVKS